MIARFRRTTFGGTALLALCGMSPAERSRPQPVAILDAIPAPRDVAYPGEMSLDVDATDTRRGIFTVHESLPVAGAGPLVLLYPQWRTGSHNPVGPIEKLAGLSIRAGGKVVAWRRDPVDVYAFHVDVPQGASRLDIDFQYLSPTDPEQGRVQMTPAMLDVQWYALLLYPAGWFVRDIMVRPSLALPAGWSAATALTPAARSGDVIRYAAEPLDVVIDSPVYAGRNLRREQLAPDVALDLFADEPRLLAATADQLAVHRKLVDEAEALFGARHFDHYDFLLSLSDQMGEIGFEHHRSSEDGVGPDYFLRWNARVMDRDVLAHEFVHSWNGKFRRGEDLWTPDYRTPMRDSSLWVYEGLTQYFGQVLATRAGLWSHEDILGSLATVAATFDARVGRAWRPLIDTTNDPIIANRKVKAWPSWQRSEDYYREGQLIWLDVDTLIRARTRERRSLDDFARLFFDTRPGDGGELTYRAEDVFDALDQIMPYDWRTFFDERLTAVGGAAPLDGIRRSGFSLVYQDKPNAFFAALEAARKTSDLTYSVGLVVNDQGRVTDVRWQGPAFEAGLTVGTTLLAVGERPFSGEALKVAITAAKTSPQPIDLLVRQVGLVRTAALRWTGGLRYPHLVRDAGTPDLLTPIVAPLVSSRPVAAHRGP